MKVSAIVPAAGRGERFKSRVPKPFFMVSGKPLLVLTLENLARSYSFEEIVVMASPDRQAAMAALLKRHSLKKVRVAKGGATRAESVKKGLLSLSRQTEWVLVHDAARPLVDKKLVARTLLAARRNGAAICALPVTATVKRVGGGGRFIEATEDRQTLRLAQTPQVFRKELLLSRYRTLGARAMGATDEAALFDRTPVRVAVVDGDPRNIKVTTREDLELLKHYLRKG